MPDDRLAHLEASVRDLDRRLRILERAPLSTTVVDEPSAPMAPIVEREAASEALTLTGRTLVALGGAYLLRALTDSQMVPLAVGVALALTYAALWAAAADRDGRRGRKTSAAFHALVACLIAFPLVWEATVRFGIFPAPASATVLTIAAVGILGVAVHSGVRAIAWIGAAMALPTSIALIGGTGLAAPYSIALIAYGVATLWVGYAWDWVWLRWPSAITADVAVFALAVRATAAGRDLPPESTFVVVAVQLLLLNAYLGSIAVRTIIRARDVILFEVIQAAAVLAIGFGGAVYVAQLTGTGVAILALFNLMAGIGCYAVAFVFVRQRPRNFYFYSSLALVLVIASGRLLLPPVWSAVAFDLLAIGCTWWASRSGRVTLTAHAAVYLIAAAFASSLLVASLHALATPASRAWTAFDAAALVTLAVAAACYAWAPPRPAAVALEAVPRVAVAAVLVFSTGGWLISLVTPVFAGVPGSGADAGIVATIRTAAIAAAAITFGRIGRSARFHESLWLLYPALALGGLKLLFEDLPLSKPSTLFLALGVYGGALILAPRLSKREIRN